MRIQDELEKYIDTALKKPNVSIADLIHHAILYGMEVQKNLKMAFPVVFSNRFHTNCICGICSRNDSYERITYTLYDLIFLLIDDCIKKNTFFILSPYPEIPSSEMLEEVCIEHGIKILEAKKTQNPCHIDVVFRFCGYLETEAALRDFPLIFTAKVELNNPYGVGLYCSAAELVSGIVSIKFMDDYQICSRNSLAIHSFYESLPKKFENY